MPCRHLEVLEEVLGEDVVAEPGHIVQGGMGLASGLLTLRVPKLCQVLSKSPAAGRSVGAAGDPEHPRDLGRGGCSGCPHLKGGQQLTRAMARLVAPSSGVALLGASRNHSTFCWKLRAPTWVTHAGTLGTQHPGDLAPRCTLVLCPPWPSQLCPVAPVPP